jgi:hypothetical protein
MRQVVNRVRHQRYADNRFAYNLAFEAAELAKKTANIEIGGFTQPGSRSD